MSDRTRDGRHSDRTRAVYSRAVTMFPYHRAVRVAFAITTVLGVGVTCTKEPTVSPSDAPAHTQSDAAPVPAIDNARMLALLERLASDDLGGRYTLSPDLARSAELVAQLWSAAGVQPVGKDYLAPFSLITGVTNRTPPRLEIRGKGAPVLVGLDAFAALPSSGSKDVRGDAVFVGYAAQGTDDEGNITYDDLADLDLEGKIAVVLLEAPTTPSFGEFVGVVGDAIDTYEAAASPLRTAGDTKRLAKAHAAFRKTLASHAKPFARGRGLPESLAKEPEDLMVPVSQSSVFSALMFHARSAPGPKFDRRELRQSTKIERLVKAGVAGIVFVKGQHTFVTKRARTADALPTMDGDDRPIRAPYEIPIVRMKWKDADKLFRANAPSKLQGQINGKLEPRSRPLGVEVALATELQHESMEIPNVVGMIPGGELAREIVLVGAHYDHIGRDEGGPGHCRASGEGETRDDICNGADDNGSGTAVVAEMARAIAASGMKPKRTLVFALFAGEELGLLGSEAMADHLPAAAPFDTGKIVAMINIDMVGRLRPDRGLAVGGVGSSTGWMPLLDQLDARGIPIAFDRSVTTRSDHASFYKHGIPVLFFFTHVHDDYHGPGDEMAAINRDGMASIASYVLDITQRVADGHALPFTPSTGAHDGLVGALPGDDPEAEVKRVGFATPAADTPDTIDTGDDGATPAATATAGW